MERKQFTFFRSFWDAVKELPSEDKNAILNAICAYALDGKDPDLTGVQASIFTLIRPILDSSARKAANGLAGGKMPKAKDKQAKSNTEADDKQTVREEEKEKEKEKEKEGEIEIENDSYIPYTSPFDRLWEAYPKKVGKEAARKAFAKVKAPVDTLIAAVDEQKRSAQWQKDNGQYIPNPATWLNQGRWEDEVAVPGKKQYTTEGSFFDD